MTTTLHPRGVNHLALGTRDMKGQLEFWCDVLGCPLRALYYMHGVDGAFHGFVELAPESYVAFVQHPDNPKDIEWGVTHAGNPGGAVTIGGMQHVALHVDTLDEVLTMRDRIRSRGVQVIGPIDHGFIKSIYFGGPEGLSLEITCGHDIDANAWVDPEVVGLCDISQHDVEALKNPAAFERPATAVAQPAADPDMPTMHWPDVYDLLVSLSDQDVWDAASEPTPPVIVD